jgi:hypothetical protein
MYIIFTIVFSLVPLSTQYRMDTAFFLRVIYYFVIVSTSTLLCSGSFFVTPCPSLPASIQLPCGYRQYNLLFYEVNNLCHFIIQVV